MIINLTLTQFSEKFTHFVDDITFNVRLIKESTPFDPYPIQQSLDNYLLTNRNYPRLQQKNEQGYNIYFRPNDTRFILLDIDNISIPRWRTTYGEITGRGQRSAHGSSMVRTQQKFKAFLILETSPHHFQAWFYCSKCDTWDKYKKIAKKLALKFRGDMGSTKSKQVGRLPRFTRYKTGKNPSEVKLIYFNTKNKINLTTQEFNRIIDDPQHQSQQPQHQPQQQQVYYTADYFQGKDIRVPLSQKGKNSQNDDMFDWAFSINIFEQHTNYTDHQVQYIVCKYSNNESADILRTVQNVRQHLIQRGVLTH